MRHSWSRDMRAGAAFSLATRFAFSNCSTAPSICRGKSCVGVSAVNASGSSAAIKAKPRAVNNDHGSRCQLEVLLTVALPLVLPCRLESSQRGSKCFAEGAAKLGCRNVFERHSTCVIGTFPIHRVRHSEVDRRRKLRGRCDRDTATGIQRETGTEAIKGVLCEQGAGHP